MAEEILHRLKYDNATIELVCRMIHYHDDRPQLSGRTVRRAMNRIGTENLPLLFEIKRADILAQSMYEREEKLEYVDTYEKLYKQILSKGDCVNKKDLAINGKDLIAIGMKPGPQLGAVIDKLLEIVMDDPAQNTKENLLVLAHKINTPFI